MSTANIPTFPPIEEERLGHEINPATYQQIVKEENGKVTNYRMFYDAKSSKAQILEVDLNGQVVEGAKPIWEDGQWDTTRMQAIIGTDSRGNDKIGTFLTFAERDQINKTLAEGIRDHIKSTGEGKIPEWATKAWQESNNSIAQYNTNLDKVSGVIKSQNVEGFQFYDQTENNNNSKTNTGITTNPVPISGYTPIGTRNEKIGFGEAHTLSDYDSATDILFKKIVKYPIDMADNMDHMFIQCYAYQPPYAAALNTDDFGTWVYDEELGKKIQETSPGFGIPRSSPFRKKLGAGFKLPMPNNMMDQNPRNWDDGAMNTGSMGAVQNAGKRALTSFFTFDFLNLGGPMRRNALAMERLKREAGRADMLANQISQLTSNMGYDIPPEQILSRSIGVIANSNTELLFNGVSLRSFEFTWTMSPRDELEAANVRMIIRAFKQWSAPRKLKKLDTGSEASNIGKTGGPSFFLGTPNIFRLRYRTIGNKDIKGVNKFKPCALTNVSVNYTPEGQWMAYDEGMPISVQMTLSFNELEPIYDTDYSSEGNIVEGREYNSEGEGNLGDLFPIAIVKQLDDPHATEIGY